MMEEPYEQGDELPGGLESEEPWVRFKGQREGSVTLA